MSDNKLLAILWACGAAVAITAIIVMPDKKSEHELRMEKIRELDAIREVSRQAESDVDIIRLQRDVDSIDRLIEKELKK
jgi:hypothetical protein